MVMVVSLWFSAIVAYAQNDSDAVNPANPEACYVARNSFSWCRPDLQP